MLVVFIVVVVIVGSTVPVPSVDEVRATAGSAGLVGMIGFGLGYGLLTLAPVPKSVISIAAGVIWGFGTGVVLVYLGALLGATLAFTIGRFLGREAVERFTGARVARVDELLQRRGLAAVISVRLMPVLPFTAINYAAGLTAVRRRDYALGTILGILPGTLAYVAVGAYSLEPGWQLWIALAALGGLTLLGFIFGNRARRQTRARSATEDGRPADTSAASEDERDV
ncbi:putative membrane protein YdjX (TVP38/TMEM64 family) [Cryobacterium psychrophilum]|uniref:TVP38/TMEM64 family membrane protein n=1 Tax=Cryobacterium psychrophilum TaxID=41988 RepID=A0A4Y8KTH3_9MICO|nr:putative membrane protein YdjX (TVP38/TMEM64 family) [Cryobacterium psychrophilum]TFD82472.1 TVP38/TMEM64 family protein [Cryobacterium psychrophilum]